MECVGSIEVYTSQGSKHIKLHVGDITTQPSTDKIDVLFISAYRGIYESPSRPTVVNALKDKLDISVKELAQDRKIDLSDIFSLWMSQDLPEDKPFGKLVCFESKSPKQEIDNLFGAMMLLFKGIEHSIMTPILGTGPQGLKVSEMFEAMIKSSIKWIKAGLPVTCINFVLLDNKSDQHKKSIEIFQETQREANIKNEEERQKQETLMKKKAYKVCKEPYTRMQRLRKRSQGKTFIVKNNSDELRVIKKMKVPLQQNKPWFNAYEKGISLLEKLKECPNVINLLDCDESADSNRYLVFEYAEMNMEEFLDNIQLNFYSVSYLWKLMVTAVDSIHEQDVVHGYLKPSHFLLVKGSVKLCDFGIAKLLMKDETGTLTGIPQCNDYDFRAPEIEGLENPTLNKEIDVWSLGCILYFMVYGKTPNQKHKIQYTQDTENAQAIYVMKRCMTDNPEKRPSTRQLLDLPYLRYILSYS